MKKTYRQIGLHFPGGSALRNEFHDLGGYNSEEVAVKNIRAIDLKYYDYVIVVPCFEKDETTPGEIEHDELY